MIILWTTVSYFVAIYYVVNEIINAFKFLFFVYTIFAKAADT